MKDTASVARLYDDRLLETTSKPLDAATHQTDDLHPSMATFSPWVNPMTICLISNSIAAASRKPSEVTAQEVPEENVRGPVDDREILDQAMILVETA